MKVERITVTAGRTRKDPQHDFSSLRSEITIEAAVGPSEDWEASLVELQQKAERLIDDHVNVLTGEPPAESTAPPAGQPPPTGLPRDPVARTIAALVTPKQLVAIRAIANDRGLNAELQCIELLKCRPEELSRRAASAFIDRLKGMPRSADHATERPIPPAPAAPNHSPLNDDDIPF